MVRVLIERRLAPGQEQAVKQAMVELRQDAIDIPGYVSGETLRDSDDPLRFIVISTWTSRARWEAWAKSEARLRREANVLPLLSETEKVTVLEYV